MSIYVKLVRAMYGENWMLPDLKRNMKYMRGKAGPCQRLEYIQSWMEHLPQLNPKPNEDGPSWIVKPERGQQ